MTESKQRPAGSIGEGLARAGGISYLHMPATDPRASAAFYHAVFGWNVNDPDGDRPSFDDGTGHVSGAWMTGQAVSREPGMLFYIYVDDVKETVRRIEAHGGEVVTAPFAEGKLTVARFRDPSGNVVGIWHDTLRDEV